MSSCRIIIVDDHPVFRQGLRDVLETDPQITVIGEAANGEMAIQLAEELEPDVMLMDINLPDIMGLQVTRRIKARQPNIKIIVVTGYDDVEQAYHAIRAGASATRTRCVSIQASTSEIRTRSQLPTRYAGR